MLYDVTTLHFAVEREDDLREVGMSKERRVDPQVTVWGACSRYRCSRTPKGRTHADLLGCPVSTGWVNTALGRTATALSGFQARLRDALGRATLIHFDETGARVAGHLRWIHVARTPLLTSYHLDDKRGQAAIDQHGVLPAMTAGRTLEALRDAVTGNAWLPPPT